MELKQILAALMISFASSFNRTFMELKQRNIGTSKHAKDVLIGPSWN